MGVLLHRGSCILYPVLAFLRRYFLECIANIVRVSSNFYCDNKPSSVFSLFFATSEILRLCDNRASIKSTSNDNCNFYIPSLMFVKVSSVDWLNSSDENEFIPDLIRAVFNHTSCIIDLRNSLAIQNVCN